MKTQQIGSSDHIASRVILGTWAIGGTMWGEQNDQDATLAIAKALDLGINAIDTAPAYGAGHAEELVGRAIAGRRDSLLIATKCGLDIGRGLRINLDPAFIRSDCEGSLRRLNTDRIDLYQIHWPDPNVPLADSLGAMLQLREEGKIRAIGVCNFSRALLEEAVRVAPIVSLQSHYSLLERGIEREELPFCAGHGIGVLSYGSLGAGMLTGKYRDAPQFKKNDARSFFYRFFRKEEWPRVRRVVDEVERIAAAHATTASAVAIAWILARQGITAAIVGARNPSQVEVNAQGADIVLGEEEIKRLDAVSAV